MSNVIDDPLASCWPAFHAKDYARAEAAAREQLRHRPAEPKLWYFLGLLGQVRCNAEEAERHYMEALRLDPKFAEVHGNLGLLYQVTGRHVEAERHLREAIALQPADAVAHFNLAQAMLSRGEHKAAEQSLREALKLNPRFADAYRRLAALFMQTDRPKEAVGALLDVLMLGVKDAEVHQEAGAALQKLGHWREAAAHFLEATRYDPGNPHAWLKYGQALLDDFRADEALAPLSHALHLDPQLAAVHNALGVAYMQLGRDEAACTAFEQAARLQPNLLDAVLNRSLMLMRQGRLEEGLAEHEKRCLLLEKPSDRPMWDGAPLGGKTILLCAEQGLGDMIQAIRYAPLVQQRGGRVVVSVPAWLHPLLRSCAGIDAFADWNEPPPPHDVYAWLMSLPHLLGELDAPVPYLKADPLLVEKWRGELAKLPGRKIAIAWQGSTRFRGDRLRSVPLAAFEPLAKLPDVTLISVQKYEGEDQIAKAKKRVPVVALGPRLDEEHGGFMDTAAVLSVVDLFVTSDSAVAHLAGALGVRTWLATQHVPDWRWFRSGHSTRWYPSMRLFRQDAPGRWDDVFAAMVEQWRQEA